MMKPSFSRLFNWAKKHHPLKGVLLFFYFARFTYYAIKEHSLFFFRYYPGYHGSTIPGIRNLPKYQDLLFLGNAIDGVNLNEKIQLSLLEEFSSYYKDFKPAKTKSNNRLYFYDNNKFGFNDGFALYCFIRSFSPARIIEIGSGHSSALMIDVCSDISSATEITFIDPYSTTILRVLDHKQTLKINYLRQEIQNINVEYFQELNTNDILFIDTSHVLKVGSDLSTIFFKIIPALKPGVIVHIHDIWYPFEYPEQMILEGRGYNEAYFVRSFLQYNSSFEILFYGSFLETLHKEKFEKLPGYFKGVGQSLWLRKTA